MNRLEKQIQRELSLLDRNLFLDKQWSPFGYLFYTVRMRVGEEMLTAVEWREGNTPLPLSMGIVDKVRSQEGDLTEAIRTVTVNNAARQELLRQKRLEAQTEIAKEFHKRKKTLLTVDLGGTRSKME